MTFCPKMPFSPPNIELEAIARTPVEASREVNCAYFGNIGRNSGGFLLPIFFVDQPTAQSMKLICQILRFLNICWAGLGFINS